jgi:hypothetical protein
MVVEEGAAARTAEAAVGILLQATIAAVEDYNPSLSRSGSADRAGAAFFCAYTGKLRNSGGNSSQQQ